jgi:site-specific DNA recombinase
MVLPAKPLAGYLRVSRVGRRDPDEIRSPDFQQSAIERYAAAADLTVRFFEPEIDVSGSKRSRAILDTIIAAVKAGELGGLIVSKLDRLSRLPARERLELFEEIEQAGGVILSASEQLDPSTPEGRFARDVFLGVARMQWEKYAEGFETAKEASIAEGVPVHTRPAVGLRKRPDKRLAHHHRTGPIVREVFERRARGEGPSALAAFLESRRVKTSQGSKTWSKEAIYNMIRNPIYMGVLRYGKDDRYVNPNAVVGGALVDPATWHAAQHPNGRKLTAPRSAESSWLLTGILRCHACRYCMQGTLTSRGKRIYRCTRRHSGGICTAKSRVAADAVETSAVAAFWKLTDDLTAQGSRDTSGDLAGLEEALERAERLLAQLDTPEAQDALGERYLEVFRQRREARDHAAAELGHARSAASTDGVPDPETLRGVWQRLSVQERRELLGLRFHALALSSEPLSIVVYPAGWDLDLPRRGFKKAPVIEPFPDTPRGARVLAL